LGIKINVADYDSLRDALREFRKQSWPTNNRRYGQTRTNYYIKPSQIRRARKGNAKIRARIAQRLSGGYTPKKE